MKIFILLSFSFAAVSAEYIHPLSDEFIDYINSLNTTWKAGRNFDEGETLESLRRLSGVHEDSYKHLPPARFFPFDEEIHGKLIPVLPSHFDARKRWPHCPTIKQIRDQGDCGACWAVSAVAAMADRHCIHSNGKVKVQLSSEDLLTCCSNCGYGCIGGYIGSAWMYWVKTGIVTGGDYGSHIGCQPYTISKCKSTCQTPPCVRKCAAGYNKRYQDDKFYGKEAYPVTKSEIHIMREIYRNGPVEAYFTVYQDYYHYKWGVYQHVIGKKVAGHALRILGWGIENKTPYWLTANPWGTKFGLKGFVKILRGKNECNIESQVVAGMPKR